MTESAEDKYARYTKKTWIIYTIIVAVVIVILVTVVARDNEEKIFYSLMTAAAAYVMRPSERLLRKAVLRLFGVSPPTKPDAK